MTDNSRQAMVASVEASLRRLKTDRIDMYWAHVSDGATPLEEIVRGFDDLARAGKILYAACRTSQLGESRGLPPSLSCAALFPLLGCRLSTAWLNARPSRNFFPSAVR